MEQQFYESYFAICFDFFFTFFFLSWFFPLFIVFIFILFYSLGKEPKLSCFRTDQSNNYCMLAAWCDISRRRCVNISTEDLWFLLWENSLFLKWSYNLTRPKVLLGLITRVILKGMAQAGTLSQIFRVKTGQNGNFLGGRWGVAGSVEWGAPIYDSESFKY